jgi:putative CocE/NonD family hydrolase
MKRKSLILLVALLVLLPSFAQKVTKEWVEKNYVKKEQMITMRDGVKLFTAIYEPRSKAVKHPIIMTRTPYSCNPYGKEFDRDLWGGMSLFANAQYIIVFQDVRGKFMSEGEYVNVRPFIANKTGKQFDEASDTYDTVDWLVKHTNNNGNVGAFGISYPGFYATEAGLCGHPAMKAVSPQAPVTEWFIGDDVHHNGALALLDTYSFCLWFDAPRHGPSKEFGFGGRSKNFRNDVYTDYLKMGPIANFTKAAGDSIEFWNDIVNHADYDMFWQERDARKGCYNVKPAVLVVGGLFDAEDSYGAWNLYRAIKRQSPSTPLYLAMGPWNHGGWRDANLNALGQVYFGEGTTRYFKENIEFPFFQYYLNGKGSAPKAGVEMFYTGANEWKQFPSWPIKVNEVPIYLREGGKLTFSAPTESESFSDYISDPTKPVPYTHAIQSNRNIEYMAEDQRYDEGRTDVVSFKSEALTDTLTLSGPIDVDLQVAITSTDADFVVSLIDVFPDGYAYPQEVAAKLPEPRYPMGGFEMLVRGDIMRGKYRESFSNPVPFEPNKVTKLAFRMNDVAHKFLPGHKLMIQIKSSWFPLFDMNPQTFTNIYNCDNSAFTPSRITIYHQAQNASRIILPVVR